MNNYRLSDQELIDLQVLHQELFNKLEADRVKSVILLGRGWTPSQVAEVLLIDRSTARHYFHDHKKGGVSGTCQPDLNQLFQN